jgi:hypothetical protein
LITPTFVPVQRLRVRTTYAFRKPKQDHGIELQALCSVYRHDFDAYLAARVRLRVRLEERPFQFCGVIKVPASDDFIEICEELIRPFNVFRSIQAVWAVKHSPHALDPAGKRILRTQVPYSCQRGPNALESLLGIGTQCGYAHWFMKDFPYRQIVCIGAE